MDELGLDFAALREKWCELPHESEGGGRIFSDQLLLLSRTALFEKWQKYYNRRVELDRWYQILYKEFLRDKAVLEIGSGLGLDGVMFLQQGVKHWTFCDIAKSNLQVIQRVCEHLNLNADFVFIDDDFSCFDKLGMFDVIWANGSLINVPFEFARGECMRILPHLKPGGRWMELCYPRERWIREGRLPFSEWGKVTDGERTPWVEWYDLVKMQRRLFPAPMEVILDFNFYSDAFNWFDLMLSGEKPFDPNQALLDLDIFPFGPSPIRHGDAVLAESGDKFLQIVTPEAIWSYAASFDLTESIAQAKDIMGQVDGGFTIELDLLVSRGHIGILVVGGDISTPVCQETMVPANTESATLMITVPPRSGALQLIFRNTAAGKRSQFEIKRIRLRFVAGD